MEFKPINASLELLEKFEAICTYDQFQYSYPHRLICLMYQLDFSILCLLRKSSEPSSIIFRNSTNGQFNNVLMSLKGEKFCIKVQHIDTYYSEKILNFNSFFSTESNGKFNIREHLNEFAEELISHSNCISDAPKYLIIYTNADLDTENDNNKFKGPRDKNLPQFAIVNSKNDENLILFFKNTGKFYRFSNDNVETRNHLSDVTFTHKIAGQLKNKGFSPEEVRRTFFDRLIFAVNQPTLEKIKETVWREMKKKGKFQHYLELGDKVIDQLIMDGKENNLGISRYLKSDIYSFNLFIFCIHNMFKNSCLNDNITGIKFDERNDSHNIMITFNILKPSIVLLKCHDLDVNKLSLEEFNNQRKIFSLNSNFALFVKEFDEDLKFFLIYTNIGGALLQELILENDLHSNCSKFSKIDPNEKNYAILKLLNIDTNNLYQLPISERIMNLLTIPSLLQLRKLQGKFSHLSENEIKGLFLRKIVFAVKRKNTNELFQELRSDINENLRLPYNFIELQKIGLNYLKSHTNNPVTKELVQTIVDNLRKENVKNDFCHQEEVEFARNLFIFAESRDFNQFMDFLIKGDGKMYLSVLKRNGVQISSLSKIIKGAKRREAKKAFCDLYNLWFDKEGNKSAFLNVFERKGVFLNNICSMLIGAGSNAAESLNNLYNLWFDSFGNPTNYLRTLQNAGIGASNLSILLNETGADCSNRFKALYNFWFDSNGIKTEYLKNLEESGINLPIVYSVLYKSGGYFEDFYKLWFDKITGEKTKRGQKLESMGINLRQVCEILKRSEKNLTEAFGKLYSLWFDVFGQKTYFHLQLQQENVELATVFDILTKTSVNVSLVFENLYSHWFQPNGEKTHYLKILETIGVNLPEICRLLKGAGCLAGEKFIKLFDFYNSQIVEKVKKKKKKNRKRKRKNKVNE